MDYSDPNTETIYDTSYDSVYDTTYSSEPVDTGASMVVLAIYLALIVLLITSMWRIFTKAGKPGWASIIPLYNVYVMLEIANRPGWWLLLYLIPFVNIVISAIVAVDIAKAFGKSSAFGIVGLWLFSIIGYPMLAFGNATYTKPAARA